MLGAWWLFPSMPSFFPVASVLLSSCIWTENNHSSCNLRVNSLVEGISSQGEKTRSLLLYTETCLANFLNEFPNLTSFGWCGEQFCWILEFFLGMISNLKALILLFSYVLIHSWYSVKGSNHGNSEWIKVSNSELTDLEEGHILSVGFVQENL